jgi:hypothetical protein
MPSRLQSSLGIYLPSTGCLQNNFSMEFHHCYVLFSIHCTVYFCTCKDPSLNCGRQIRRYTTKRPLVSSLSAEAWVRSQSSPCRSFGEQNGYEKSLCQNNLVFHLSASFYQCSLPFHSSVSDAMPKSSEQLNALLNNVLKEAGVVVPY